MSRENGSYDLHEELSIQRENEFIDETDRLFKKDEYFDDSKFFEAVEINKNAEIRTKQLINEYIERFLK